MGTSVAGESSSLKQFAQGSHRFAQHPALPSPDSVSLLLRLFGAGLGRSSARLTAASSRQRIK